MMSRHPDAVLSEASLVARSVDGLVRKRQDLVQMIAGRKHPRFELLQIVATMFQITARVRETRHVVFGDAEGWEAIGEAFHVPTGQVIASAEGMCTTDEPDWAVRPKYEWRNGKREKVGVTLVSSFQRRSMAQTRACSKAIRLALGWVLGLAGYEATAAEEMTGDEVPAQSRRPPAAGRRDQAHPEASQAGGAATISQAQQKRFWAIANEMGLSRDEVAAFLR